MFEIYILVHTKSFVIFLEAHPLQIFLEVFYWLWPAQAGSELGLIYGSSWPKNGPAQQPTAPK
jgi:hypothetical protein